MRGYGENSCRFSLQSESPLSFHRRVFNKFALWETSFANLLLFFPTGHRLSPRIFYGLVERLHSHNAPWTTCWAKNRSNLNTFAFLTASRSLSSATTNARRAIPGNPSSSNQVQTLCMTRTGVRRGAPGSSSETMAPTVPLASVRGCKQEKTATFKIPS